jgi:5'-3' exonuclease
MQQLRNKIPLIDGDVIVYRCGFACKDDEPIQNHIQTVKAAIDGIMQAFPEAPSSKLFISGRFNFREQLATILPYKGNRQDARKPVYYKEIREYLVERLGAVVVDGMEADDALGMAQWAANDKSTCIVSIDKDLNMIPGWHYNWVKKVGYWVHPRDADMMLWKQMLEGDRSDNIPGIPGIGPKTVEKIVAECNSDPVRLRTRVEEEYQKLYGATWQEAFDEVANLLWIFRTPTTTWKDHV